MPDSESNPQKPRTSGDEGRDAASPSAHGFLITDAAMKLIFANKDASAILTYPSPGSADLADVFQKKFRPALVDASRSADVDGHFTLKLRSGRRIYVCSAFPLDGNSRESRKVTLLMLERGTPARLTLSQIARQFRLSQREQEAVILLLRGLSNKEIAETMGVSANTVKAFLRTAAVRMGGSSRSGIIAKILECILSGANLN